VNAKTVSETKPAPEKKAEKKPAAQRKPAGAAAASSPRRFAADRLMNVVLAPVVSEKSTFVADKARQYVFRVADDATKPQIKAAVELMFKTKVEGVTVLNVKGKERRFGRTIGRRRSWKKAYVRLAEGQEINFAATQ
jgi:large subunit ribosomal protein L23